MKQNNELEKTKEEKLNPNIPITNEQAKRNKIKQIVIVSILGIITLFVICGLICVLVFIKK